jgi:hypothetical protein
MHAAQDQHTPILVHIEPRGFVEKDLFCDRSDGPDRMADLQQKGERERGRGGRGVCV